MRRSMVRVVLALVVLGVAGVGVVLNRPSLRDWMYREASYQVLLESVVGEERDPYAVTTRLMHAVHQTLQPNGGEVIDTDSWTHLVRGIGWCDQQAWTLGTLLSLPGIHSRLVMLKDSAGRSPHTVLDVLLDGEWRLVDPTFGFIFRRPDGSLATLQDLSDDLTILTSNPTFQALARGGREEVLLSYEAVFPIRHAPVIWPSIHTQRRAQPVKAVAADLIHWVWPRLGATWAGAFQDLYLAVGGVQSMGLERVLAHPKERNLLNTDGEGAQAFAGYVRARNYHLYGRLARAAAQYRRIVASYPRTKFAEYSLVWLGRLELQQGQAAQAAETLGEFLASWPDSAWSGWVHQTLARAYEALGDEERAAQARALALADPQASVAFELGEGLGT